MTGWWLGASVYDWGYLPYYNPYYTQSYVFGPTVIDYEQPVQVVDYGEQCRRGQSAARLARGDAARRRGPAGLLRSELPPGAESRFDQALELMPGDPAFHELRALILFAMGEYRAAAAAIHSLLAVGPGWDWTTMIGLYANDDIYTKQLRALEIFRRDHPNDAAARFLLAYHYLTMGHTPAAATELRAVVQLRAARPRGGPVALDDHLVAQPGGSTGRSGPVAATRPRGTEPDGRGERGRPSTGTSLNGTWTARREDGSSIQLTLTPDSRFTWRYSQGAEIAPVQRHGHRGKQSPGPPAGQRGIDGRPRRPHRRTRFPILSWWAGPPTIRD